MQNDTRGKIRQRYSTLSVTIKSVIKKYLNNNYSLSVTLGLLLAALPIENINMISVHYKALSEIA